MKSSSNVSIWVPSRKEGVLLCLVSSLSVIKHKQNPQELFLGMILLKVCSTHCSFHLPAISELVNHRHINYQPQKGGKVKEKRRTSISLMPNAYQKSIISFSFPMKILSVGRLVSRLDPTMNS